MSTVANRTKITIDRLAFLEAFGIVSGVAPPRSPKMILQNLKLDAHPDTGCILSATDLEIGIRQAVRGVKVDDPMSVILPTAKLGQILRMSRDAELVISTDGDSLVIKGEHSTFKLPSEDPDLFPSIPEFTASEYFRIEASDLRRAIRRTSASMDVESVRYALGGSLLEFTEATATFVSTDGRRLSRVITPCEMEGSPTIPATAPVIPARCTKLIEKVVKEYDASVWIAITSSAIFIQTDGAVIYSRLLEGRFPRYQDVFPATFEVKIPLTAGPLRAATEQGAIVTSDESRGVDFNFEPGKLVLKSQAADSGQSTVELPIDHDGPSVVLCFDPRYLIDVLKPLDDDTEIVVELIDERNAAVFRTGDSTFVIMPLTRDR